MLIKTRMQAFWPNRAQSSPVWHSLAQSSLAGLTALCSQFGLSMDPSGKVFEDPTNPLSSQSYVLAGAGVDDPKRPVDAISFRNFYRFSNALIALSNAVFLASKVGASRIHVPKARPGSDIAEVHDLVFGSRTSFLIKDKIELCRSEPDPEHKTLIGSFFHAGQTGIFGERPPISDQVASFANSLAIDAAVEPFPANEPVIHIRSGDVFRSEPKVHPVYGQPPLAYYKAVLSSMDPKCVHLVFEDRRNPVIDQLIDFLNQEKIRMRVYSGALSDDIQVLLRATVVIAGFGTFMPGILWLSKNIQRTYYFGRLQKILADAHYEIRLVRDRGDYAARVMSGNWVNSAEQLQLMVDYGVENIEL